MRAFLLPVLVVALAGLASPATAQETDSSATSRRGTAASESTASSAASGKALFESRCGMCHLQGGTGTFMLRRRLGESNALLADRKAKLDAAYVKQVVRSGIVSMPRITRAEVSDAELEAIVSYLTRQRKAGSK